MVRRLLGVMFIAFITVFLLVGCSTKKVDLEEIVQEKLTLAAKNILEGKYEEARLIYSEVLEIDEKNVAAYLSLGKLYSVQEKFDEAEKSLLEGLQKVEDKKDIQVALADTYLVQGEMIEAENLYKEVLTKESDYVKAHLGLAQLYLTASNEAGAYQHTIEALKLDAHNERAYSILEALYSSRWDKLIERGKELLNVKDERGYLIYTYALLKSEKYNDLNLFFVQNTDILKQKAEVIIMIALASFKSGKVEKANELLEYILSKDLANPSLLNSIANFYREIGEDEKANQFAMKSIVLDFKNIGVVLKPTIKPESIENNQKASEEKKENKLSLVKVGKLDGVEFGIGTPSEEIVKKWGEPDYYDSMLGGHYFVYDNIVFFNDSENYNQGQIAIIAVTKGRNLFGVEVGMTIPEIKEELGKPVSEGYISEEDELNGGQWGIHYEVGDYKLGFYAKDKKSATISADLVKKK